MNKGNRKIIVAIKNEQKTKKMSSRWKWEKDKKKEQ
jgi:hypothetical protein